MLERGIVTEAVLPTSAGPCFALPLVRSFVSSNSAYIQRFDRTGRVAEFDRVNPPKDLCQTLEEPFHDVRLGQEAVHVVRTPDGDLLVGRRAALAAAVAPWVGTIVHPTTRLVFADFVNDRKTARRAALVAFEQARARDGVVAAERWVMDALVLARVHRAVFQRSDPTTDPDALDRLVAQCRVDREGPVLQVVLPTELQSELGLPIEGFRRAFSDALNISRVVGAHEVLVRAEPGGGMRRRREPVRTFDAPDRTVSIVVVGEHPLFDLLVHKTHGIVGAEIQKDEEGRRSCVNREAGVGVAEMLPGDIDPEALGRFWHRFPRYKGHSVLLALPHEGDAHIETLLDKVALVAKRQGWPEHDVCVAVLGVPANEMARALERRVVGHRDVGSVLSLANSWTPVAKLFPQQDEDPSSVAGCIQGWIMASLSGAIAAFRRKRKVNSKQILTASRWYPGPSPKGLENAALSVANPLWPDVTKGRLIVGSWAVGAPPALLRSAEGKASGRASRFATILRTGPAEGEPHSGAGIAFALSATDAPAERSKPAVEGYVSDILVANGWRVVRDADGGFRVRRDKEKGGWFHLRVFASASAALTARNEGPPSRAGLLIAESREGQQALSIGRDVTWLDDLPNLAEDTDRDKVDPLEEIDLRDLVRPNKGLAMTGGRVDQAIRVPSDLAVRWMRQSPGVGSFLRPLLSARDVAGFPACEWVLDFSRASMDELAAFPEQLDYAGRLSRKAWGHLGLPALPPGLRGLPREDTFLATPVVTKRRAFVRCGDGSVPGSGIVVVREARPWLLALLSSRVHRIWVQAIAASVHAMDRYTVRAFETFPVAEALLHEDELGSQLASLGDELQMRRMDWQYRHILDIPRTFHGRLPAYDQALMTTLAGHGDDPAFREARERTLISLYDRPPEWLMRLNEEIDELSLAAYHLAPNSSDESVIRRLAELNMRSHGRNGLFATG